MNEIENIFEEGDINPYGKYFIGQSYLAMLTELNGVGVANVTFEPGCRNNRHIHHGIRVAGKSCSAPEAVAGIRNGVRKRRSFIRVMLSPFPPMSSIGTVRQRIVGLLM